MTTTLKTVLEMDEKDLQSAFKRWMVEAVEEMKNIPVQLPPPDRITLNEACAITGLSRSLIYKMTMAGTIPHEKYGKRLVFSRMALQEWVQSRTIPKTIPETIMTERLALTAKRRL